MPGKTRPWAYCSICKFYKAHNFMEDMKAIHEENGALDGDCRRYPPKKVFSFDSNRQMWPQVMEADWCGEFIEQ